MVNNKTNNNIKKKLQKAKNNYAANPGNATEMHRFYDRIIRLATNSSNTLFPRKEPKENWSKYNTEEEYEESLKSSIEFSKKFTEKEKKSFDVIIFHKNADGAMSGYIAWDYLTNGGENKKEVKILQTRPDYGGSGISYNIQKLETFISGKNVLMVDLSYNLETIEYLKKITNFFVTIDNHPADEINKLPYAYITDTYLKGTVQKASHATCAAVWKFFHPDEKVPYIIQSIDSSDVKLYLKYLPDPDAISMAINVKFIKNQTKPEYHTNPVTLFEDLHEFMTDGTNLQGLNFLAVLGQVMNRYAENMKTEVVQNAQPAKFVSSIGTYNVWILNYAQPGLIKRVGKNIAEQHRDSDFAVVWFYDYRFKQFEINLVSSHRPGDNKPDINKIAKSFGGRGLGDTARFSYKGNIGDLSNIIR